MDAEVPQAAVVAVVVSVVVVVVAVCAVADSSASGILSLLFFAQAVVAAVLPVDVVAAAEVCIRNQQNLSMFFANISKVLPVVVAVVELEEPAVDRRSLSSLTVMPVSSLLVAPRKTFWSPRT